MRKILSFLLILTTGINLIFASEANNPSITVEEFRSILLQEKARLEQWWVQAEQVRIAVELCLGREGLSDKELEDCHQLEALSAEAEPRRLQLVMGYIDIMSELYKLGPMEEAGA
jgi:predicted deacetylase